MPLGRRGRTLLCCERGPLAGLLAGRKQILLLHLQRLRQIHHFRIFDAANLGFDFGDRVLPDVPTSVRATRRQHGLGQALAVANLSHDRADDVLGSGFAHSLALTVGDRALPFLPISEDDACATNWPKRFESVSQDTAGGWFLPSANVPAPAFGLLNSNWWNRQITTAWTGIWLDSKTCVAKANIRVVWTGARWVQSKGFGRGGGPSSCGARGKTNANQCGMSASLRAFSRSLDCRIERRSGRHNGYFPHGF